MERYELNGLFINTTKEMYESKFKALGYVPVKEIKEPKKEAVKDAEKMKEKKTNKE